MEPFIHPPDNWKTELKVQTCFWEQQAISANWQRVIWKWSESKICPIWTSSFLAFLLLKFQIRCVWNKFRFTADLKACLCLRATSAPCPPNFRFNSGHNSRPRHFLFLNHPGPIPYTRAFHPFCQDELAFFWFSSSSQYFFLVNTYKWQIWHG